METRKHILMVDDERHISAMTRDFLEAKGFTVTLVHHADAGLRACAETPFDLCLLDIRMPMKDGFVLASEIRETHAEMPVIFLTGKTDVEDRLKGLKLGADDYITKPFNLEELDLRIRNIFKRTESAIRKPAQENMRIGKWSFNPDTRELQSGDQTVILTTTEAALLKMFCSDPAGMLNRDSALRRIWSDEHQLHHRSLNVYISKLRKLFREDEDIEILNVHGVGYRLVTR